MSYKQLIGTIGVFVLGVSVGLLAGKYSRDRFIPYAGNPSLYFDRNTSMVCSPRTPPASSLDKVLKNDDTPYCRDLRN